MKWAKYFGLLLLSFCLFFGLSPLKQAEAAYGNINNYNYIFVGQRTADNKGVIGFFNSSPQNFHWNGSYFECSGMPLASQGDRGWAYTYDTLGEAVAAGLSFIGSSQYVGTRDSASSFYNIVVLKNPDNNGFTVSGNPPSGKFFNNIGDYEDATTPSWWDNVKTAFMDFVGSEALSDVLSGDWLSYISDVLFGDLWTVKVGEGEDDMIIPETVSATPTPSTTPIPTPIPYSTVIDPGTGEIHYHYTIDVSGTPVPTSSIYPPVTSSPPGPGSGSTIDEPVAVEDYYEPEDSLSVPKLRIFKFLLRMTGNDVDVGMDSLDNNMAVMDATLEDNAEAISGVGDLFQLIPVTWFILIGTLACFPVIAAMIKSLLGG